MVGTAAAASPGRVRFGFERRFYMRKHLYVAAAAAAMALSPLAWSQNTPAESNNPSAAQSADNAGDQAGNAARQGYENTKDAARSGYEKSKDAVGLNSNAQEPKDASGIQKTVAQVAEAAVTKNGLDDMAERFVDADRNRLGQDQDALKNNDTLNGRIAQFEKDWKDKYGHEFNVNDPSKVYDQSFAMITEGEETGAQTASGQENPSNNANNNNNADNNANNKDEDKNLNDKGRNIAALHIPASNNLPALQVPLIHEAGGWKLDIPDSVDSKKLSENVLTALTKVDEMKAQWPSDETQAQRHVTHQLLMAIFDKSEGAGAQPAGAQLPSDQGNSSQAPSTPSTPSTPGQ
jgi:hypothetical protein